ncbi:thioredoxin family protein [Dysgonomonas sp. OttesenSCG-928-M03]|nr:thioredoxin family protein [Dysgonomonas sp. OttesenSCG-928-M03]
MQRITIALILLILSTITIFAQEKTQGKEKNNIITLSAKNYEKETNKGIVLVDYWATWCGPCKKMEPILKEIANQTIIKVAKLNVDDYKTFVKTQKVGIIPTMIIYKDGIEVERLTGTYTKEELLDLLNTYIEPEKP